MRSKETSQDIRLSPESFSMQEDKVHRLPPESDDTSEYALLELDPWSKELTWKIGQDFMVKLYSHVTYPTGDLGTPNSRLFVQIVEVIQNKGSVALKVKVKPD
jgi:hypothetical protein